jgi:hypothetical protein
MSDEIELKPCAYCPDGGEPEMVHGPHNYQVHCKRCEVMTWPERSEADAARNWNARPIEDAQAATIAELMKSMNAADTLAEGTLALMNAKIDAQAAEIKRLRAEKELTCTWSEEEEGTWSTSCGELWSFNDGDPADNSAVFCHHCGKRILANKYQEESEEE